MDGSTCCWRKAVGWEQLGWLDCAEAGLRHCRAVRAAKVLKKFLMGMADFGTGLGFLEAGYVDFAWRIHVDLGIDS